MNLFVTHEDPFIASTHLDDVRLNKMILESCQMLLTALANNGLDKNSMPLTKSGTVFKTNGFKRHPVTVWTGQNLSNLEWHLSYLKGMLQEYVYRFNKIHSLAHVVPFVENNSHVIAPGELTKFQNSSEFKDVEDTVEAYRMGMNAKWLRDVIKVKWSKRQPPEWVQIPIAAKDSVFFRCRDLAAPENRSFAIDVPNIKHN